MTWSSDPSKKIIVITSIKKTVDKLNYIVWWKQGKQFLASGQTTSHHITYDENSPLYLMKTAWLVALKTSSCFVSGTMVTSTIRRPNLCQNKKGENIFHLNLRTFIVFSIPLRCLIFHVIVPFVKVFSSSDDCALNSLHKMKQ